MTTYPTDALWILLLLKAFTVLLMGKPLCWFPQIIFGVRNYLLRCFTKNVEREYIALKHIKWSKIWHIWVQKQMHKFMMMSVLSCPFILSYGRPLGIDWFGPRLVPGSPTSSSSWIMVQIRIRKEIPSPSTLAGSSAAISLFAYLFMMRDQWRTAPVMFHETESSQSCLSFPWSLCQGSGHVHC